ncbi:Mov34/MPN/PAD-1 family protein [Patulibacter sp. NPDC049589]|uniref:Mov34/MPN/PAD-1 family protein n=1 Tax=Patulibacter sp. NPDC049589 TaxID=3154731 RepID=UPI003440C8DB
MSGEGHRPRFRRAAHETILDHVFSSLGREVGGVLVGEYQKDPPETHVLAAIPALEATSEVASVTFTHDAWSEVHAVLEEEHPGRQIVGWYHSHPGFGIFLSEHDLFIQRNFFSGVGQVAHVVDPRAGTEGVFGWRDGEIAPIFERPTTRPGAGGSRGPAASRGDGGASGRRPERTDSRAGAALGSGVVRPRPGSGAGAGAAVDPDVPGTFATPVADGRPAAHTILAGAGRAPALLPTRRGAGVVLVALLVGLLLGFVVVSAARADPAAPAVVPVRSGR